MEREGERKEITLVSQMWSGMVRQGEITVFDRSILDTRGRTRGKQEVQVNFEGLGISTTLRAMLESYVSMGKMNPEDLGVVIEEYKGEKNKLPNWWKEPQYIDKFFGVVSGPGDNYWFDDELNGLLTGSVVKRLFGEYNTLFGVYELLSRMEKGEEAVAKLSRFYVRLREKIYFLAWAVYNDNAVSHSPTLGCEFRVDYPNGRQEEVIVPEAGSSWQGTFKRVIEIVLSEYEELSAMVGGRPSYWALEQHVDTLPAKIAAEINSGVIQLHGTLPDDCSREELQAYGGEKTHLGEPGMLLMRRQNGEKLQGAKFSIRGHAVKLLSGKTVWVNTLGGCPFRTQVPIVCEPKAE